MGYSGFGLQKWIYNLKPRKPFKKGTKGAGYETYEINIPNDFKFKETRINDPELAELRLKETRKRFASNSRKEKLYGSLIVIGLIVIIALVYLRVSNYSLKSNVQQKQTMERISKEKEDALELLIMSGKLNLQNNDIEYAINDFTLALNIDPRNPIALYNLTLAFSIDCEKYSRNCDETIVCFEKLKNLDEKYISEELEMRIIVVEEIIAKKSKTVAN